MGIFSKDRTAAPPAGLGRGVVSDGDADVLDLPRASDADADAADLERERRESMGAATASDAARIVDEVKPRGGLFRRGGASAAPKAGKPAQAPKPAKAAKVKAARGKPATEDAVSDDVRLSTQVLIDFFPEVSKQDAVLMARHWALDHSKSPSNCYYMVMKVGDGYAIEVQDGVGKAYLPSVIKLAQENPGRLIVVPMVRRKMTIYYSMRNDEFEAQILPEREEPPAMAENPPIYATRGPVMTPVAKQFREWLIAGAATAAIGGLSLLLSIGFYAFDSKSKIPPEWRTTDVAQLPIMQWGRLQPDSNDSYVVRMEYSDGQWRIVRQAVSASVDVAKPAADGSGVVAPVAGAGAGADETGAAAPMADGAVTTGAAANAAPAAPGGGVTIPPPGPAR